MCLLPSGTDGDFLLFSGIRQLQLMLLKIALIVGVEVHVNVEFVKLLEPPEGQGTDGNWPIIMTSSFEDYIEHSVSYLIFTVHNTSWQT